MVYVYGYLSMQQATTVNLVLSAFSMVCTILLQSIPASSITRFRYRR